MFMSHHMLVYLFEFILSIFVDDLDEQSIFLRSIFLSLTNKKVKPITCESVLLLLKAKSKKRELG